MKSLLFIGHLILFISWIGQSTNIRSKQNSQIQLSTRMFIVVKPQNLVLIKLNDFTVNHYQCAYFTCFCLTCYCLTWDCFTCYCLTWDCFTCYCLTWDCFAWDCLTFDYLTYYCFTWDCLTCECFSGSWMADSGYFSSVKKHRKNVHIRKTFSPWCK